MLIPLHLNPLIQTTPIDHEPPSKTQVDLIPGLVAGADQKHEEYKAAVKAGQLGSSTALQV